MVKVLYTTPVLEHPATGGPQLRIENSIKALSKVSELYIISRLPANRIGGLKAQRFYEKYCVNFLYSPLSRVFSANRYLRKLRKVWAKFSNVEADSIIELCNKHCIDIIWFGYGNISFDLIYTIKKKRPEIRAVCDTDSVWSRYVLRELPYEKCLIRKLRIYRVGKKKEREERAWVNLADITTAVSDVDAQYYRAIAKTPENIQRFSNVIDVDTYDKKTAPPKDMKRPSLYLAGTFGPKSPMDKAARWFIRHVWPAINKTIPNIHFYIVGRGSTRTLSDIHDSGITITGKLPSVLGYLCNVNVSIVPLKFESGTRFKILEAGACGIPVVSTTLGAEGLPVTHEKDILIADTPDEFATAVIKLIQNKNIASQLGENLRNLVCSHFSVKTLENEARGILGRLTGSNGGCRHD